MNTFNIHVVHVHAYMSMQYRFAKQKLIHLQITIAEYSEWYVICLKEKKILIYYIKGVIRPTLELLVKNLV